MSMTVKGDVQDLLKAPDSKRSYNEAHFTEAAKRYDFATKALSLGMDQGWKSVLVDLLPDSAAPVCVDLACGTGDIALALAEKYPLASITGIDLTEEMLKIARRRASAGSIRFLKQDLCEIPFPDGSVDIVTGSYALRNAPDLVAALTEIRRVLKPNGTAAFLDFWKPSRRVLQMLQYWVLRLWGSFWGLVLHGDPAVHGYISASLRDWPDQKTLQTLYAENGFYTSDQRHFCCGMTGISVLRRL